MNSRDVEMISLKPGRRPTGAELEVLRERRASQYEGKTAHFSLCVFNLMNAILGSGILGLANAMSNLGYILFSILLVLVAGLAFHSIRLLLDMCDLTGITSYEVIGTKAFGKVGKFATAISILVHTLGAMCTFLFIVKYELPEVLRTLTNSDDCSSAWYLDGDIIVVLVTLVVVMPLAALKNIGFLGYTSGFAMGCMIFFTVVIIIEKFIIPCPIRDHETLELLNSTMAYEHILTATTVTGMNDSVATVEKAVSQSVDSAEHVNVSSVDCAHRNQLSQELEEALDHQYCEPKPFVWNSKSAYAVPTMVFAFQCHASVLPIYLELANPTKKRMQAVAVVSIGNIFVLYFVASLFGYLTFFNAVGAELLLTYTAYDPNNIIILLARIMVLICVIFSTPLLHFPARRSIENMFFWDKPFSWIRHLAIMVCLLTITDLLVVFVPTIRVVFGFIGATSASMLVIILPSLFYLRLGMEPLRSAKMIGCACLVGFGTAFMILSLILISLSLL